ncbi:MAG: mechanosensitive ion channel family protein [Gammaproteobacteria bacterium]|nr:mechanosensitive ion channel family protein [Gammaproteobacteria bacterium]
MNDILSNLNTLSLPWRLVAFAGLAVATHLVVIVLRQFGQRALSSQQVNRHQKLRSIATLTTSALVFTLYFLAVGLILREFGVSLTAYLASASVVGLAIGFGSQGIVQDVVTGLTFIFSDLVDVGDLVEISGQTGIVKAITMRFVELGNAMGATVFIPNRTINNVINYPRGYVRCIVDITLRGDDASRDAIEASALRLMSLVQQQFPGIQMREPSSEGRIKFDAGKEILRIKFRIWPNREKPIETTYFQELISEIKGIIPDYQPWMVSISYEVEKRVARAAKKWLWQS